MADCSNTYRHFADASAALLTGAEAAGSDQELATAEGATDAAVAEDCTYLSRFC
mgnify:CR=1 FL=1